MNRARKVLFLGLLALCAASARADWSLQVKGSAAVAITVPASQTGYCGLAVRQNYPVSGASVAYTVWVGATLSGNGTVLAAGQAYVFPCVGTTTYAGGTTVGWIQANQSGTFLFRIAGTFPSQLSGGSANGAAGGDLAGNFPNPTVANLSNVSNASLGNAGLAHPSVTVGGVTCTLGASCSPSTSPTLPVAIATSSNSTIGIWSGTYTSGITATGTTGQTCALSSFNGGGSGATATVALTGSNTIAGASVLVVTALGSGFTSAPTSATAGNGTATCSGTATVSMTLSASYADPGGYAYWIECGFAGGACIFTPPNGTATTSTQRWYSDQAGISSQIVVQMLTSNTIDVNGSNSPAAGCAYSAGALGDSSLSASDGANHYKLIGQSGLWNYTSGSGCL